MAGRPCKLNDDMRIAICAHIANGHTYQDACLLCGITEQTLISWRKQGAKDTDGIFFELLQGIKAADASFKETHLSVIRNEPHWTAHAWLLERKYPQEFGRRETIALEDKLGSFVEAFDAITKPKE